MLELIVLGHIPGTHLQITYTWLMLFWRLVACYILTRYVIWWSTERVYNNDSNHQKILNLIQRLRYQALAVQLKFL